VVDEELSDADCARASAAGAIIFGGTVLSAALAADTIVALPLTNVVEEEGTFTNLRGRVQRYLQAKSPPALARPSWFVWSDVLSGLGHPIAGMVPGDIFAALAADVGAFHGLSYAQLGLQGAVVASEVTA
jgi:NADH-quinone oxidoreductase subunit G